MKFHHTQYGPESTTYVTTDKNHPVGVIKRLAWEQPVFYPQWRGGMDPGLSAEDLDQISARMRAEDETLQMRLKSEEEYNERNRRLYIEVPFSDQQLYLRYSDDIGAVIEVHQVRRTATGENWHQTYSVSQEALSLSRKYLPEGIMFARDNGKLRIPMSADRLPKVDYKVKGEEKK